MPSVARDPQLRPRGGQGARVRGSTCASRRSASARSSGRLVLKNGSTGAVGKVDLGQAMARGPDVDLADRPPPASRGADRRPAAPARGRTPDAPGRRRRRRRDRRPRARPPRAGAATRSSGKNGVSVAIVAIQGRSGRCARAHSMPVSTPASGPAKPATTSAATGRPKPREARRVAVGVEQQGRRLRPRALDHLVEDGAGAERSQALVAAAHAPRLPAREQHAEHLTPAVGLVASCRRTLRPLARQPVKRGSGAAGR